MHITLLTAGKIKHSFFAEAEKEYAGRMKPFCDFQISEVPEEKLTKNSDVPVVKKKEAERFLEKIPKNAVVVVLDERGKEYSAKDFSGFLEKLELSARPIVFVIGGANGLDADLVKQADHTFSLGKMTLTQDLARIVFLETLFRGFCIRKNLPFHR
jgi:23S rRNA (pseudouridine1915-N3)-methyltransferase